MACPPGSIRVSLLLLAFHLGSLQPFSATNRDTDFSDYLMEHHFVLFRTSFLISSGVFPFVALGCTVHHLDSSACPSILDLGASLRLPVCLGWPPSQDSFLRLRAIKHWPGHHSLSPLQGMSPWPSPLKLLSDSSVTIIHGTLIMRTIILFYFILQTLS